MFHEKKGKNFFGGWEKCPALDPRGFVGGRLERIGISAGRFLCLHGHCASRLPAAATDHGGLEKMDQYHGAAQRCPAASGMKEVFLCRSQSGSL